jgi:2-methylisocitrate lyase-like PEP mutase family enzyme
MPLALVVDNLRRIVNATLLPVTSDLESGYGGTPEAVGETIGMAIDAGAVGCNLEDSLPGDGKLRGTADQCARIRAARQIANERNFHFFINARTDVFFQSSAEQHDHAMVAQAIERAHAYADAGADGIFAPGVTNIDLIARLAKEASLPLNIMVEDATPSIRMLADHGVARVSHGPRPYISAMKSLQEAAHAVTM